MTEKLFYTDSHLQEFTAEVVSCRPCDNGTSKNRYKSKGAGNEELNRF